MISKSNRTRTWGLLAALVFVSGVALAQANTVTYQGVLRDAVGDPVADGPYAMSFGVFAAESGGSPLWTESQTATTLNGAFSVELGAVTPLGTLFVDNAGGALWLEVSADIGGGMQAYLPRVPLTRAPYAFHATHADSADTADSAGNADTVDGKHAADIDADIGTAVSAHDVSGASHGDIRGQIGTDIAAHDASGAAHNDIRTQIGTDIAAHDADTGAHAALELDAAQITSGKLSNDRLTMGHGGGIDADKLDGLELSSIQGFVTTNITNNINAHNGNPTAHQDIRDKIGTDIDTHDDDSGAHANAFSAHNGDAAAHPALHMPPGVVMPYAGAAAPAGYLLCAGQAVSRTTYAALFAVVGTTYGAGDGSTTFGLPDLRGRGPIGLDNMGGSSANRVTAVEADALGGAAGAETHTLSVAQMPAHNHGVNDPGHAHTYYRPRDENLCVNWGIGCDNGNWMDPIGSSTNTTGITIANAGSGQAHNNMAPYMAMNYIIKH
ncbi:MAG TPA: tail fiber protein [Candidatus Hydrogenedentes bacterium]|nr:tail fiber protein [Candidatus Hydrogenedentota bacterium]